MGAGMRRWLLGAGALLAGVTGVLVMAQPAQAYTVRPGDTLWAIAQRNQNLVAVMLVSIDRFKKVTESLGHAAGDVVLTEAAARLQCCITSGDTVARFEGDEFALLLTNVAETADLAEITRAISADSSGGSRSRSRRTSCTTSDRNPTAGQCSWAMRLSVRRPPSPA